MIDKFYLYPDDFIFKEDIYYPISVSTQTRSNSPVKSDDARNLALSIASSLHWGQYPETQRRLLGHIVGGNNSTAVLCYCWNENDYLIMHVVNNRLVIGRGDLIWIGSYPFIEQFEIENRSVSINESLFQSITSVDTNPAMFITNRKHFGHLIRDTIACELSLFKLFLSQNAKDIHVSRFVSFSYGTKDNYLSDQIRYSLHNNFNEFRNCDDFCPIHFELRSGTGILYKQPNLYFASTINMPRVVSFYHQNKNVSANTMQTNKVHHLGMHKKAHQRISNSSDMITLLQKNSIDSLTVDLTPKERSAALFSSRVVIAEPSSSIYNYITFCHPETVCILLLPSAFRDQPLMQRDAYDWSGFVYLLLNSSVVPFYSEDCDISKYYSISNSRLIDIPMRYNFQKLEEYIHKIAGKV